MKPCRSLCILLLLVSMAMLSACAKTTVKSLTAGMDQTDEGIRFYGSSYYVFLYDNGKGEAVSNVAYLPDPNKLMTAKPVAIMASNAVTLTFDELGNLTGSKASTDSTAIPKAILDVVGAAMKSLLKYSAAAANEQQQVASNERLLAPPAVFKLVMDKGSVRFIGAKGDVGIRVPFTTLSDGGRS